MDIVNTTHEEEEEGEEKKKRKGGGGGEEACLAIPVAFWPLPAIAQLPLPFLLKSCLGALKGGGEAYFRRKNFLSWFAFTGTRCLLLLERKHNRKRKKERIR